METEPPLVESDVEAKRLDRRRRRMMMMMMMMMMMNMTTFLKKCVCKD